MKNISNFFLFLVLIGLTTTCNNKTQLNRLADKTIVFDKSKLQVLSKSVTTDSTSVIKLETTKSSIIGEITKMYMTDSVIVIFDKIGDKISIFNPQGLFIRNIGHVGKGRGEYAKITDMCFYSDCNQIEVFDIQQRKLSCFNLKGELLFEKGSRFDFLSFYRVKEGYWVYSCFDSNNSDKYNLLLLSNDLKSIKSGYFPTENYFDRQNNQNNFIKNSNGDLFFYFGNNTTIYKIKNREAKPYLSIDFGHENLPYEEITKLKDSKEYEQVVFLSSKYFGNVRNVSIGNNILFFSCSKYSMTPTLPFKAYCNLDSLQCKVTFETDSSPVCVFNKKIIFSIYPCYQTELGLQTINKMYKVDLNASSNPLLLIKYARNEKK